MKRWSSDPWAFILECCWTIDEADAGKIKRFPDKEYLKHVCTVWLRENLLAVPKSRRMLLTWVMLALHLWAALACSWRAAAVSADVAVGVSAP